MHMSNTHILKPLTDIASKCSFCLQFAQYSTEHHHEVLQAIVSVATSGIHCSCHGATAIVYLPLAKNWPRIGQVIKGTQIKYSAC